MTGGWWGAFVSWRWSRRGGKGGIDKSSSVCRARTKGERERGEQMATLASFQKERAELVQSFYHAHTHKLRGEKYIEARRRRDISIETKGATQKQERRGRSMQRVVWGILLRTREGGKRAAVCVYMWNKGQGLYAGSLDRIRM